MAKRTKKPEIRHFNVVQGTRGQTIDIKPILEFVKGELLDKTNGKGEPAWIKAVEFNEMFGLSNGKVKRYGKNPTEFESVNNKCVDLLRQAGVGIRIARKDDVTWVSFRKKVVKKKK